MEEQEDSVMDVKRRHEREKTMMLDENKKLIGDVERVSGQLINCNEVVNDPCQENVRTSQNSVLEAVNVFVLKSFRIKLYLAGTNSKHFCCS